MASEISITLSMSVNKGNLHDSDASRRLTVDMTGSRMSNVIQTIGTATHVAVTIASDVSTNVGFARMVNLSTSTSTSDYMQLGIDNSGTFAPFSKLRPGHIHSLQLATKTIYAKAFGSAQDLQAKVFDE